MVVGAFVYLRGGAELRCPTVADVDLLREERRVRVARWARVLALRGRFLAEIGEAAGGERLTARRIC